jgi:aldose 1-epimerase
MHPYAARTKQAALGFEADTMWQPGPDSLPTTPQAIPPAQSFSPPRPIGDIALDACFAGWGGSTVLSQPEHGIALHIEAASPLDHFQVYTPVGEDFCGLEPVSNMPDGINRMQTVPDQGMRMLNPGDTLRATVTLRVSQASR